MVLLALKHTAHTLLPLALVKRTNRSLFELCVAW
jgi:hypothetical protein